MNLHVDLIFETEQRSASVVNAKGLIRIVSIVIPLIVIVIISVFTANMMSIKSNLKALEADFADKDPKKEAAIAYRAELVKNRQVLEELEGWRLTRVNWAAQLERIAVNIPDDIQLTVLRISSVTEPVSAVPARNFSLLMKGKTFGEKAKANVELLGELHKNAAFTNLMKEAKVADYKRNEDPVARDGEMLFQVEAVYKPLKFK